MQMSEGAGKRYDVSLEDLLNARADGRGILTELEQVINEHDDAGRQLIAAYKSTTQSERTTKTTVKRAPEVDANGLGYELEDIEEEWLKGTPPTPEGREFRVVRRELVRRTRRVKFLLHKIEFHLGHLYKRLKNRTEEQAAYLEAEKLRRSVLHCTSSRQKLL